MFQVSKVRRQTFARVISEITRRGGQFASPSEIMHLHGSGGSILGFASFDCSSERVDEINFVMPDTPYGFPAFKIKRLLTRQQPFLDKGYMSICLLWRYDDGRPITVKIRIMVMEWFVRIRTMRDAGNGESHV